MTICPHCRQPIASERLGVRMSPLKAALFDAIKAAGDLGVTSRDLLQQLFGDRHVSGPHEVKMHVYQINELLEATDFIIRSQRGATTAFWHLERRRVRAVA